MEVEEHHPKPRRRMKQVLNDIKETVEFYFSDANLRRDRFFRKEIDQSEDGYVDFKTILNCNKVKSLEVDEQTLTKAIENSKVLELNEEKTKVKRCTTIPELNSEEADSRIIYVERLYAFVDHDWLKKVFSICGKIQYISLPRYKHDNKIKGFAFIEFATAEEAERACKVLNSVEKKSPKQEESSSPMKGHRKRKRSTSFCESESDAKKVVPEATLRRRRTVSECSNETVSPAKTKKKRKSSLEDRSLSDLKGQIENNKCETGDKDNNTDKEATTESSTEPTEANTDNENVEVTNNTDVDSSQKKKKNRKHTKRDKEVKEVVVPPLYVISKAEWLSFKRQYKHLQRKEFQKLKRTTKILKSELVRRKELKEKFSSGQSSKTENREKKSQQNTAQGQIIATNNDNKIGQKRKHKDEPLVEIKENSKEQKANAEPSEKKTKNSSYELEPGSVIKVATSMESLTRDVIKTTLSPYGEIAYVDYINGALKGYVRFKSAESRKEVEETAKNKQDGWQFKIEDLKEGEEEAYFKKALEERAKRYELNEKKKQKRQQRGTMKVLKQAEDIAT